MKKYFALIALMIFMAVNVFSQEDYTKKADQQDPDEIKTLFKKGKKHKKPHIGYFLGPEFAYTGFNFKVKDANDFRSVFLLGISMGATFNRWISVGLAGYGIVNSGNLKYKQLYYEDEDKGLGANLYGGYGGLVMEFTLIPKSVVHVSFPLLIGGGYLTYLYRPEYTDKYDFGGYQQLYWDTFFVIQPGVKAEFNIVKFFRIGIGVSYRYTPDLDLVNTSKNLINQFNANLSLRFGKF